MIVKKYKILHIPTSTFMMVDLSSNRPLYFNQEERIKYPGIFNTEYGNVKNIVEIKESNEIGALKHLKKLVKDYENEFEFKDLYGNELFYCLVEIFEEE